MYKSLFKMPNTGIEVIKFEYSLKLKIKCNDWLHGDTCIQQDSIFTFWFAFLSTYICCTCMVAVNVLVRLAITQLSLFCLKKNAIGTTISCIGSII